MFQGEAEDADGLTPVKDDNEAMGQLCPGILVVSDFMDH